MVVTRRRQDAVRHRPGERSPLDVRPADVIGPRLDRRDSVATDLTQKTGVAMPIVMTRELLSITGGRAASLQTERKAPPRLAGCQRHGDVRNCWRQGLNGQGQHEDENAKPVATHGAMPAAQVTACLTSGAVDSR